MKKNILNKAVKQKFSKIIFASFALAIFYDMSSYASEVNSKLIITQQIIKEKNVSLNFKDKPLKDILLSIQKQTKIGYGFNGDIDVDKIGLFSIDLKNVTVEEALNTLLKNSEYVYTIVVDSIVIEKRKIISTENDKKQKVLVRGRVLDKDSQPVIGATIIVKETAQGTISGSSGEFNIIVPVGNDIEISCVGYVSYNRMIDKEESNLVIELVKNIIAVDDVIVNGYFARNKDSYTGSAIQVKAEDLKCYTSNNVLQALSIFDPSFRIVENNLNGSNPNSLPELSIRGRSGIGVTQLDNLEHDKIGRNEMRNNPNMPTFILDGYEVAYDKIYDIDIDRIESITILKDAASTAIYGSRAANGVVIINTKLPKAGKFNISYNFNAGIAIPDLTAYDILNAEEKLKLENEVGLFYSESADANSSLIKEYNYKLSLVKRGVDTYWLSQPLKMQFNQRHSLYADGGNENVRYALNFSYNNDNGVMKGSVRDRGSLGFTLSYNLGDKLRIRNSITTDIVRSKESPYGSFSQYPLLNPYYPVVDENGELIKEQKQMINTSNQIFNPVYEATVGNINKSGETNITNNFNIEWNIFKGLRLKADFSYSMGFNDSYRYLSPESLTYYDYNSDNSNVNPLDRGEGYKYDAKKFSWNTNVVLTYFKMLGKHSLNFALGGNVRENGGENTSFSVIGFPSNAFDYVSMAKEFKDKSVYGDKQLSRLAGAFLNLNYMYDNRYMLDFSYRVDGSSVYGTESKFAPFWSAGIGWNIHNEKFMSKMPLDQLKLRATIGSTGKASFAPYQAQTMFQYMTDQWYATGIGLSLMAIGNDNLKWEVTDNYDVGVDVSFLENRLSATFNYYIKKTKNLLSSVTIPTSTGFNSYSENLGRSENSGYEVYLRGVPYKSKNAYVSVFVNMAHNKNKLGKISNSLSSYNSTIDDLQNKGEYANKPMVRYNENESMTAIYVMQSQGIDPANGRELYIRRDGTFTYDWDSHEQIVMGDSEAKVSGAFGLNVNYKSFDLNMSFNYRLGGQAYNQTLVDRVENADIRKNVDRRVGEQRWINPGDNVQFKNIMDKSKTNATSRFLQDDNLLEMGSVSISYTFKRDWIKHIGIQNLRLTAMYNNPFRISSIKQERGINYPFARNMSFALMVSF